MLLIVTVVPGTSVEGESVTVVVPSKDTELQMNVTISFASVALEVYVTVSPFILVASTSNVLSKLSVTAVAVTSSEPSGGTSTSGGIVSITILL